MIRDSKTHCVNGHEFKPGSFRRTLQGTRICKVCIRERYLEGRAKQPIKEKRKFVVQAIPAGMLIPKICSQGHVVTPDTTRVAYVAGKPYFACRICQAGAIRKFETTQATEQQVRDVMSALRAGRTLTDCYGLKNGNWIGDRIVRPKHLANFMNAHPRLGAKIRALARQVAYPIRAEVCRRRSTSIHRAAPALLRNGGADAYDAIMRATSHLWEGERGDVMSLMFVAVAEGRLTLRDIGRRMPEFLRDHRRQFSKFGPDSLDRPLFDDSGLTLGDTITAGLWQ